MLKLEVQAPDNPELAKSALSAYHPYACVVYGNDDKGVVIPCVSDTCFAPLDSADGLKQFVSSLNKKEKKP
jgi:hypothetical protein